MEIVQCKPIPGPGCPTFIVRFLSTNLVTVRICHADFRQLVLASVRLSASSGFTDTSQAQECAEYVLCHLLRQRIQNAYQIHLDPPTIEHLTGPHSAAFGALVRVTLDLSPIVHFYTQAAFVHECVGMAAVVCIDLNQDHSETPDHDHLTHHQHSESQRFRLTGVTSDHYPSPSGEDCVCVWISWT